MFKELCSSSSAPDFHKMLLPALVVVLMMSSVVQAMRGLYPPVTEFSNFKPVKASSSCGLQNKPMSYCMSARENSSLTTCSQLSCLLDCCKTCGKSTPTSLDVLSGAATSITQSIDRRPGSTASSRSKVFGAGSRITYSNLPAANVRQMGLSFCVWVKQQTGNIGALISKGNSYTLIIKQFDIDFIYTTSDAQTVVKTTSIRNINLAQGVWMHVAFTVYGRHLSVFTNGQLQRTVVLDGIINDFTAEARIGQQATGVNQFIGQMQDAKYFTRGLSNREVIEAMNGTLPSVYGYSYCRCPPSHPRIAITNSFYCTENGAVSTQEPVLRLSSDAHPPEYLLDGSVTNYWISEMVENATIEVDLVYRNLQIFLVQIMFYSPPAKGIMIERSLNGGKTYRPWQYYADNCPRMFGLQNNGPLPQPDSVNCLQMISPRSDFETFSFQTQEPGPKNRPQRTTGEAGCKDFHCSPKLLEFVKATNVRISFYQHTLVTNPRHRYFGVRKILVSGTCDCYGHSNVACTFYNSNSTHNASYTCTCDPTTFTEGSQCERCKPLYRDKPFKRGMVLDAYPCKKCNCNDHATSCTYNSALDTNPSDRNTLGGGVCDSCLHNTAGRFCETCKSMYYRPSGKALNALDVCSPCNCIGDGILTENSDCQRDDSNSSMIAGQCPCKKYTTGRQCSKCKDGYYYLTSVNPEGCISCGCNTLGSLTGNTSCDSISGQCHCKTNVIGLKCDRCRSGFYGLSASKPAGCSACNCDPWGSSGTICNVNSGQCPCKSSTEGLRCHNCKSGYFGLRQTGCQQCRCNVDGTDPARLNLCNKTTGNCHCRTHVEGNFCDRCKVGYYGLSASNAAGCVPCNCDNKGTIGNSGSCSQINGSCSCKAFVTGKQCNQCKAGTFNLSAANPNGCSQCNCNPNGTVDGGTKAQASLPCFNNGQCSCLTNVIGPRCDRCINGYYWNPSGAGCIPCNCNVQGSASSSCNSTGYCTCRVGFGVGGRKCDQCLPGYYSFSNGRCTSCGCSAAGSLTLTCDSTGRCLSCKPNVQGTKCSQCKPGTSNLQASNSFGCSGPPSQQGPPSVSNIKARSMLVSWSPPDTPNGLILRYELYRNNSLVYNASSRSYNDTGLIPYTLYSYHIIVHTAGGSTRSVDSSRVFRTLSATPEGVRPPQMTNILSRSMLATWPPPVHPNGIIIYKLSSTNNRDSNTVEHYNGNLRSYEITSLQPFTVYYFTLIACSTIGCANSSVTTASTRSARPDSQPAPYTRPLARGQSVFVYWDAPARPNGVILFYDLFMRQSPFTGSGTTQALKLDPLNRNYTVTGLVPYTEYEFRIVSYTAQVSGDTPSTWTRVRTLENVPSGAEYISPRAVAISSTSLNISWYRPRYPNGIITRYEIYRYESSDLSAAILTALSIGAGLSSVVTGLKPYTSYQISVKACNSKGCTGFSSRATISTLADAPSGQGAPNTTAVNSSMVSLSWSPPSNLNGPLPIGYVMERSVTAFGVPPPQVESGLRFSSFGLYQLPSSIVPDSTETRLEISIRTAYPDGLLFYAASSLQKDMFAVEIRSGKAWFVFDTETGPAAMTTSGSQRVDDGKWHKILVTRSQRSGILVVDGVFTGSGVGGGSATVIGQISSVYVGGLPASFTNLRSDSGNNVLKRAYFVGCIKNMKYKNAAIDFNSAIQRVNTEPLYGHCPAVLATGFHFKGGGYMSLRSGLFTGRSIFFIQVSLRTTYKSGLILFAHGAGTTSFAITLENGNITLSHRSPTSAGSDTADFPQICNGRWHNVMITGFASFVSLSVDGVQKDIKGVSGDTTVNSTVYMGGVPKNSKAESLLKTLSKSEIKPYGGCMKNLKFAVDIDVHRDVTASSNVALDGCPVELTSSVGIQTCSDPIYSTFQRGFNRSAIDKDLQTFTEYLYRVKSYRSGITGFGESSWVAIRTKEGAPSGLQSPTVSNVLARRLTATWGKPSTSGGLLTKYQIKAVDVTNASSPVITLDVNDVNMNTSSLIGLSPYTRYNISIVYFTAGGNAESDGADITTLEAAPEMLQPVTALSYPYHLVISWKPPVRPNGKILTYQLFINGETKYSGNSFTYNATGLSVYTSYTIKITACNSIGCISATTSIFTGQLPPSGIHAPQLNVLGSRRIEVRWRQPDVLNGVISKYQVQLAERNTTGYKVVFTGTPTTFYTILANMTPGTNHFIRIAAFTAGGAGIGNVSQARTLESAPEDVPKPIVIPVSSSVLDVTIRTPLKPNGIVLYYVLLQDDVVVGNGTGLHYQRTGFLPYSRHTFRTSACTARGCGESDLAVAYTLDAQPVGNVSLQAHALGPRSFTARWNAVQTPNGIIRYSLMVTGEFHMNMNPDGSPTSYQTQNVTRLVYNGSLVNRNFTYAGLLPYSHYRVQVNASNRAGFILSNTVGIPTAAAAPDGVNSPVIKAVNSTAVNVTWNQPGRANGLITSYQLIGLYPLNDLSGSYRQVSFEASIHYYRLVSGLQPYTNYSFKVVVTGSGGITGSQWTNATTPEDVPQNIDQPKIINIESRSIFVEISAPAKPNGKIIHYIFYLNNTEMNRTLTTRFGVVGLQPFSFYVARIEACTVIGCRSSVATDIFQTLQDAPIGQPAPILRANGSRSVVISWSKPLETNGIILLYDIQRRMRGQANTVVVGTVNATISANVYVDKSVKPWTSYEFRVIARTVAGGTAGPYSSVKTPQGDPEGIAAPTVSASSSSSLSVTWTAPSIPNGHVTHYYVVTTGRKELINRTTSLTHLLTGLGSYIEYPVVISACTIGGCGNSPATRARTLTSPPAGQGPPTAEALTSSSLRVRWSLPTHPNGPLVSYNLWRRTVEDVVSGNVSSNIVYPTAWVSIYRGVQQFFDDTGLGIYSLQSYMVMAITTVGNTSSNASSPFRTGAAAPLQGVSLSASAIDHSRARLSWTLPPLRTLRGPAVRFDISYEIVNGPVFVSQSLDGNVSTTVIRNLIPNTRYAFKVVLFNGAGSKDSAKAFMKTLDGAPEGFDKPSVYVVSATQIRVSWTVPRTPNGVIYNYTIYGNSKKYDTLPNTTFTHIQDRFKPYTLYAIQVRVCTRYSCTFSGSVPKRTSSAAPGLINPPRLIPVTSTSIRVEWDNPVEPNGIITGYKLFRRRVYNCPTRPIPVTKCTYVECSVHQDVCGGKCFNPKNQKCCNGTLHTFDGTKHCCGTSYLRKNTNTDVCCGGQFYVQQPSYQCCHGYYTRVPSGSICCKGPSGVAVGIGNRCCGDVPYDVNGDKSCICGALYNKFPATRKCCGGRVVAVAQECCGNATVGVPYDRDARKSCCGTSYVDSDTSLCCQNSIGQFQVHYHRNATAKSRMKCCGTNEIMRTSSCCNNQSYANATQVCSDRSSSGQTGCGSGNTCPISQSSTAYCNRCDFPSNKICGSVSGYFDPSANQTSAVKLCFSAFTELNPSPLTARFFVDTGLQPHTLYDYYISAINEKGNSSSATNRTRTLMSSPEGVSPPKATVLSASSIAVTWSAPTNPNGVVNAYKLYRIKETTKKERLVFSGMSFAHTDTQGLEAFTGYRYKLSVCTVLCTNVSATSLVYTQQAVPQNVHPPVLVSVSATVVRVNWTTPGSPNGIITRYNVTRLVNSTYTSILPENDLGLEMTKTVSGLKPYTVYTFQVAVCTKEGCSIGLSASIRTLQAPPQDVKQPLLSAISATSIEAQWRRPAVLNGILLHYVLYRNVTPVYNGSSLKFRDTGLTPNTAYSYTVEAVTGGGGTRSASVTMRTPESSPEGIAAPTITPVSATQLRVSWTTPSRPNGVITKYELLYNELGKDRITIPTQLLTSYTISSLRPFTQYEVRIVAFTSKGFGTGNPSISRTLEASPVGQAPPVALAKSDSIMELTWSQPSSPNGIITRYELTRREQNEALSYIIYAGPAMNYIDTGLQAYTVYQYKVRSRNSAGSVESTWVSKRTISGVPQGLIAPTIVVLSGVSVQASWPLPTKPNGLITQYEVRFRRFNQVGNESIALCCINANTRNVTVTGLKPATKYEFRISARSDGGVGYSDWTSGSTKEARPSGISALRSNKNPDGLGDGKSLQVQWSPPSIPNGVITNYLLYLDTYVVYEGLLLQAVVRRLQPYTNYTFHLEACNSAGCTKGPMQTLITAEILPVGQIPPTFGTVNATSVTLRWGPPVTPNGQIVRYDILRRISARARRRRQSAEAVIYSTNDTLKSSFSHTDSGLMPFSTYQYKIRAVNSRGSIDSQWATVKTAAAAPTGFSPPIVAAIDGFSVQVQWSVPRFPNGVIKSYEVYRNKTKVQTLLLLTYTDTKLDPVTWYAYSIRICTNGGCTLSKETAVRTKQAAPGEMRPPILLALDSSRIRATWSPPSVSNGQIQKYQLRMANNARPVFEGLALQYIISGLKPYTSYSVVITACTSLGCGSPSSVVSARTLEALPQDISRPSLYILGSTIIDATWSPPRTPNGVIRYYTLRRDNIIVYNGTALRFTDKTVAPGTQYMYTISCTNGAGSVTSPPQQSVTTDSSAPQNVAKPSLRALSRSAIEVTWQAPKKPNGVITGYYVLYDKKEISTGTKLHHTAQNLNYYTVYEFRISACTSAGCTSGLPASTRTLESAPTNQSAPTFSSANIGARYILAQWKQPQKPNGVIIHYQLRRREVTGPAKLVYHGPKLVFNDSSADVRPNVRYEYQVISSNSVGSASSSWVPVTTNIAKPEQVKPVVVINKDIKSDQFVFSVEEPGQPNGRITKYIVELIGLKNITLTSVSRGEATGLKAYTGYSVRVYACNSAGCSYSTIKVVTTAASAPTGFNSVPVVVSTTSRSVKLRWQAPTNANGPSLWYQVNQQYNCPQLSVPPALCFSKEQKFNASTATELNVTGLLPYSTYKYTISAHTSGGFATSPEVSATTSAEYPIVLSGPNVTVSGNNVKVDWTRSFDLRSALEQYTLEENNIEAYTGNKLSVSRPNREVGVYTYIIKLKTSVNGKVVNVAAPMVRVTVGDVAPALAPSAVSKPLYKEAWFIVVVALVAIILLLILLFLLMRQVTPGRNVYVRERTPLPLRPKSKMGSRSGSRITLNAMDSISLDAEKRFPYIGTPSPNRRQQDVLTMTPNLYSSRRELLGSSQGINQTVLDDKLSYSGPDDPTWDNFLKSYNGNGRDRDSGLFDDNSSPVLNEDDEPMSIQSFQKGRIVFPDTHL